MAVVRKSNGKLRICIDPQPLNTALMREHYRLTTLEDVLPKLANARIFSKLDIREAYYASQAKREFEPIDHDDNTIRTIFRWTRLPFGLKVSSEIFQRKLTEAVGDLNGTFTIADDIIIAGCGQTDEEAKRDHETKLCKLYARCKEQNIILNDEKKEIGLKEITFHGHKITSDGVKVDDKKVNAIRKMPTPTDVAGVKRLCGMVQYMAKFLPDLANEMEPIRELTRKEVSWNWSNERERAFQNVKKRLTEAPILAYFDTNKEVVLQVDSSKNGVGAVLLQDGKPV